MALSYLFPVTCTPGARNASPGIAFPSSSRKFACVAGNNSVAPLLCCAHLSTRNEEDGKRSSSKSGVYGVGPLFARRHWTAKQGPSSSVGGQRETTRKSDTFGDFGIKKLTIRLPLLLDDIAAAEQNPTVRRQAGDCLWATSRPSFSRTVEVCSRKTNRSSRRALPTLRRLSRRRAPAAVPGGAAAVETVDAKGLAEAEEVINAELKGEEVPQLSGGSGGEGGDRGDRGNGGGGGDGAGDGSGGPAKKMSPSQILTLIYAALVGVGGLIGFSKSGSTKSLATGGGAALALLAVFSQLPAHPTFASSVGLGISAVLLGVMYPRFKKSGKFMPAGLVALVSLIMTGGYLHGIVRTAH